MGGEGDGEVKPAMHEIATMVRMTYELFAWFVPLLVVLMMI